MVVQFRLIAIVLGTLLGGILGWTVYAQWSASRPIYLTLKSERDSGHRFQYDSQLGWVNVPGFRGQTYGKRLTINSTGLRNREVAFEKPAGVGRILVLGDSFAWGQGVADEDTFATILEKSLADSGRKWEVINTAVSGWGTDQEYLYLQQTGFKYAPDIVVVSFYMGNDFENNAFGLQYGLPKPFFIDAELRLRNVPVPRPDNPSNRGWHRFQSPDQIQWATQITGAILQRMAKDCQSRHCKLVVMKFGDYEYHSEDVLPSFFNRELQRACVCVCRTDLSYFDVDRQFEAHGIDLDALVGDNCDHHWDANGHALAARFLLEYLEKEGSIR